jgi:hypothetical protein
MELMTEATITQIIEITDKETGKKEYLISDDESGEWKTITEEKYLQLIGDNNGE